MDPCIDASRSRGRSAGASASVDFCGLVVDDSSSLTNNTATKAGSDLFMHDLDALKVKPAAAAHRRVQEVTMAHRTPPHKDAPSDLQLLPAIAPELPPLPSSSRTLSASPPSFPSSGPAAVGSSALKQQQGTAQPQQYQQQKVQKVSYGRSGLCLLAYSGDGAAPGVTHFVNASTIPARISMEGGEVGSDSLSLSNSSSSGSVGVCRPLLQGSLRADEGPLLLGRDSVLPPVQVAVQDELGSLVMSEQLVQQITVAVKARHVSRRRYDQEQPNNSSNSSSTNMVGVMEGQTQLVPNQGLASFSDLQLMGPPGEVFNVTFSLQQLSSGEITLEGSAPSLLVQLPSCQPGQVVKLSGQGLPIGCATCRAPLFAFNTHSNECLKCSPHSSKCGGSEMLADDGYFQWHPLSTQLLECPDPNACKAGNNEALRIIQQRFVGIMYDNGSAENKTGRNKKRNSSSSSDGRGWSGRKLAQDNSSSGSTGLYDIYQQLQCAEGYTGPLCSTCVHDPQYVPAYSGSHPLLQNLSSAASASSLPSAGKRYGKFHQSCKACPTNRSLSVLYYLLARFLDLLLIAVQVVLVVRERHKRIVKLNKQHSANMTGKAVPPPRKTTPKGVAAKVVAAHAWMVAQAKRVWPKWLRSSLALAPLMRKEHNKVPKPEELASEFVVQVSPCMIISWLGRLGTGNQSRGLSCSAAMRKAGCSKQSRLQPPP